ncbi:HD domain-containing protein [Amedibacillus sp. YH-ame10]
MEKAIFSKVDLNNEDCTLANEYLDCIKDLLGLDQINELQDYVQHMHTSRFQHSLNVSYYTFLLARKFHLDAYSAARAGLLHDLYLYDRHHDEIPFEGKHRSAHPKVALENARKATMVNAIIEDAILHHMWPITFHRPKTKEGLILQAVDKYCALSEVLQQCGRKIRYNRFTLCYALIRK